MKVLAILVLALAVLSTNAQKVNFQFFYESLCPGCYDFLTNAWKTAIYTPGLLQIFDLNLYPYGNGRQKQVGNTWEFTCQHGEQECYGNIMETCMIHLYPDPEQHLKAIICLEEQEHIYGHFDNALSVCALQFKLEVSKVNDCMNSSQGNQFQHEIAQTTDSLNPPHKWVPWLVVNGKYSDAVQDEVYDNPVKFICQNYQGPIKVQACNQYTSSYSYTANLDKSLYCMRESPIKFFLRK